MWFYLTFAVIAGGCATFVIHSLLKNTDSDQSTVALDGSQKTTKDVAFYQRQLTDIDRDVATGTLSEEEAARTRVEISRRLLDADNRAQNASQVNAAPKKVTYTVAFAITVLMFGAGGYLYSNLGGAGLPDAPLAQRYLIGEEAYKGRLSQEQAELETPQQTVQIGDEDLALIEQLRVALKERPTDAVGHRLLAKQEAALGNFTAARLAQSRVVEIAGPTDVTTNDLILLGRIMVYGTAGYVSPQAEAIWGEVLARAPSTGEARFYMGLMFTQTGRPDVAFPFWEPLMETGDQSAPWMDTVREQIATVAYLAGEKYTPPASDATVLPGPNAEQVNAAQEMSMEERQEMIVGMVANLGEKLEDGEGTVQEWARYIRANGVLGNMEAAKEAHATASAKFADDAASLQIINESLLDAPATQGASE